MKNFKLMLSAICLIMSVVLLFSMTGCSTDVSAATVDLMENITAQDADTKPLNDEFISSQAKFSVELFKKSFNSSDNKNMLISPLSVSLALSMTANGAKGQTLTEMETLLGDGLKISDLNGYQKTYLNLHNNEFLKTANSIWFRDCERFSVKENFLQTNADYYGADAFKSPFDSSIVDSINSWVKENTDGMIEKMVEDINENDIMYLLNAVSFEAEWLYPYTSEPKQSTFKSASGKAQTAFMMHSEESSYITDGKAQGFIKPYKGKKYSLAVLLPNEDISINDYISGLSSNTLMSTLKSRKGLELQVNMPKFSYDYSLDMSDIFKTDIPTAFNPDSADFTDLGTSENNLYIAKVQHKTNITVDIKGTKAGAATSVSIMDKATVFEPIVITLNRPFVYMIIDNETDLPVFMGAVMSME